MTQDVRPAAVLPVYDPPPGHTTRHRQIEAWLASLILDGTLSPGQRLPPERDLAEHVGVSRMTLRHALADLTERDLIHSIPGRAGGAFVSEGRVVVDLSELPGLALQITASRKRPHSTIETVEQLVPPRHVLGALGLPAGSTTHYIERIRWANDSPIALERSYFPAALLPDLPTVALDGSLYQVLDDFGHRLVTAQELLSPILDPEIGQRLQTDPALPLLRVVRTAWDRVSTPVEYSDDVFCSDRVELRVTSRL